MYAYVETGYPGTAVLVDWRYVRVCVYVYVHVSIDDKVRNITIRAGDTEHHPRTFFA